MDNRILPMVMYMKAINLSPETEQLVKALAALGNPARLRILEILARNPQSIVADIVRELPIAQATVSQHLAVLTEAGLIYGEQDGAGRCCRIDFAAASRFAQAVVDWTLRLAVDTKQGETCRP